MDLLCTCTTFSPVTLLRALALRLQFVPSSFEGRQSAMVLAKDLEGEWREHTQHGERDGSHGGEDVASSELTTLRDV